MNKTKELIIGLAAVMALAACNETGNSTVTPQPAPESMSEEGGISSGGGGTLPADPAEIFEIKDIFRDAKRDLRLLFRYQKYYAQSESLLAAQNKFYLKQYSLLEALEDVELELLTDKACKDGNGNEVDGSIYASRPNTICISAFRIAPKVAKELARHEVLALVAHELGHVAGASEQEAVAIQKNILFQLKYHKIVEFTSSFFVDFAETKARTVSSLLDKLITQVSVLSDAELVKKMSEINSEMNEFQGAVFSSGMAIYLRPQDEFLKIQYARYLASYWQLLSKIPDSNGQEAKSRIEDVFGLDTELTYEEYYNRIHTLDKSLVWPNEKIKRLNSRLEIRELLIQLKDYFHEQSVFIGEFKFSSPLPKLRHGPWATPQENPWKKFVGEYTVVDRQCSQSDFSDFVFDKDIGVKIEIPVSAPTEYEFVLTTGSGRFGRGFLSNNTYTQTGIAKIEGDDTYAARIGERGDRWFGGWEQSVENFEQNPGFVIWKHSLTRKDIYTNLISKTDCTIKLLKK